MTVDLLEGLNPQQRAAVSAGDGPVLVLAGPGSGKTRVLTHRIAYLCQEQRIYPDQIVAVTFTNKAAGEMRERSERLLGGKLDGLQIGTFHAICARILRREADHTPYGREYAIYDTDDQISVMKQVLAELNVDVKKFSPGRVLNAISGAKNELIAPEYYAPVDYFGEIVHRAYPLYQSTLVNNNAMDFDDLLMQTVVLLRENDEVCAKYQRRFQHVLVDEFQDTNQAQYQLVRLFSAPQENVFVVGDEDQGIYAFRGADYRNVMQFRHDYPQAQVILLEQNYRSTQIVLDAARAVIDKNQHRTPKALFTDRQGGAQISLYEAYNEGEEATYVAEKIRELLRREGYAWKDFAVMYRTNAQSRALEDAMVATHIPYRLVGGVGFYKRQEIRDLLAYLRLIHNPNDTVSFRRIVNVPGRGIGKKSIETFHAWAGQLGEGYGVALGQIMQGIASPLTGRAVHSLVDFGHMLSDWREIATQGDLVPLFDAIVNNTGYIAYLSEISDRDEQVTERIENIQELRNIISEKKDLALGDFLEEVSLVAEVDTLADEQDSVTLLTLHSAKGLEYPVVFMTGLEDGLLPHSRSLNEADAMAEERRLMYVGLTRAKDRIYLTYVFRRMMYGESIPSVPSRFLGDIPADLTEGVSVKISDMRDRSAYQRMTTWDSASSWSTSGSSPKIIPFPGSQAQSPTSPYRVGQRVQHATFGEGVIQHVERVAGDIEVVVSFTKVGVKRLSTAFANLKLLD
ncbi:MAG: UvrD-helicase domain-containing protein [Anaerolineae bacterium]|nr:UvrD-helicase domain-containing protein [Anaerolineae bacterium]